MTLGGCQWLPIDSKCDDNINCTKDSCSTSAGCEHIPDHSFCKDSYDCTSELCSHEGCIIYTNNNECDDEIDCTMDICTYTGCENIPMDSLCNDDIGCTADTCEPSLLQKDSCVHTPINSRCSDGFKCTAECCNVTTGCEIDFSNCPSEYSSLCLNCKSSYSRVEAVHYNDQAGGLRLKTRIKKTIKNVVATHKDAFLTNLIIENGQVIFDKETSVQFADEVAVVSSGKFKIQSKSVGDCNDLTRGQIVVVATESGDDRIQVCLRTTQGYQWINL